MTNPEPATVTPSTPIGAPCGPASFYSRGQIRTTAVLGTTLAAAHLAAANWRELGRPRDGRRAWTIGTVSFAVNLTACALVPDTAAPSAMLFAIAANLAVVDRLHRGQQALVDGRVAGGARTASTWGAVAIALAYQLMLIALVVAAVSLL